MFSRPHPTNEVAYCRWELAHSTRAWALYVGTALWMKQLDKLVDDVLTAGDTNRCRSCSVRRHWRVVSSAAGRYLEVLWGIHWWANCGAGSGTRGANRKLVFPLCTPSIRSSIRSVSCWLCTMYWQFLYSEQVRVEARAGPGAVPICGPLQICNQLS